LNGSAMGYLNAVTTYDAIVPAGGTLDPEFAAIAGTDQKALVRVGERTILECVLKALRESGIIRNIVVVGSPEVQSKARDFAAIGVDPGSTGPDNIFKGLDKLNASVPDLDKALIVTCDLPFITGESVRKYLEVCPNDVDICVPIIDEPDFHASFPGTSSTFVKTRDGVFTIGGMFLMNARNMPQIRSAIERVFAKRKSKLGMAKLIGPTFIFKFLTKTLTIRDLENKIQSMLGCTGKAVRGAPTELAYDIDDREDYEYAVRLLKGSG
jgi:GTP:adenosylcobinamide-phosphate guanylyltransferase